VPLVETKTVEHDGVEVSRTQRVLYSLAELKEGKHIEGDIVEAHVASAFDRACENIGRMKDEAGWTSMDLETEISEYLVPEVLGKAGITTDPKRIEWDVSPTQSGRFFMLDPSSTKVDASLFLHAMKQWFAGIDWRGPDYKASTQKPRFPVNKKRIDLRSADAWHARHGSLAMQKVSHWSGEVELEPDYDYEFEFSEEFMTDCNDFLEEILQFCFRTLRDSYENEFEEETIVEDAEANEWRFTKTGDWA